MALRDQPYIPLYIQDFMTDEKLNMCSWATQGIYVKIMCVLHKQENYGSILFKQNVKQSSGNIEYFAAVLVKNLPCQMHDMISAITELIDNGVMYIDSTGLHQKRMKKDGETSIKRSKAAKDGGGNPNLFKQNVKQTYKQNTENEIVIENEINNNKKESEKIDFKKPDIDGDEIIFPIDTEPMRQLWATWKESRWRNHEVRYSFAGEQSALKQLQSMDFHKIENTIQQAIAGKWKNLYPESNGKQQQWRGKRNQGTAIGADAVFGPQECGDL